MKRWVRPVLVFRDLTGNSSLCYIILRVILWVSITQGVLGEGVQGRTGSEKEGGGRSHKLGFEAEFLLESSSGARHSRWVHQGRCAHSFLDNGYLPGARHCFVCWGLGSEQNTQIVPPLIELHFWGGLENDEADKNIKKWKSCWVMLHVTWKTKAGLWNGEW